ncbi:MAG TPA: hypothetical protein VHS97_02560, partial [Isosphaeraceae bacterium]|nr:hypothetical protein [Isosphaeraceae bacterium]
NRRAGVLAATGMILGACYLLWMLRKVIFGPLLEPAHQDAAGEAPSHHAPGHNTCSPVGWHEIAGLTPIMGLIVAIGVFPRPFLEQIRPAVARLDDNVQSQRALANKPREVPQANPPGSISQGRRGGGAPAKKKGGQPRPKAGSAAPKGSTASANNTPKQ